MPVFLGRLDLVGRSEASQCESCHGLGAGRLLSSRVMLVGAEQKPEGMRKRIFSSAVCLGSNCWGRILGEFLEKNFGVSNFCKNGKDLVSFFFVQGKGCLLRRVSFRRKARKMVAWMFFGNTRNKRAFFFGFIFGNQKIWSFYTP